MARSGVPIGPHLLHWFHTVRNLPLIASVAWRHLNVDAVHALWIALRALPSGVRRALAVRTSRGSRSVLGVLALAADGRRVEALETLRDKAFTSTPRRIRYAVAAAAALDDPDLAESLLQNLARTTPASKALSALVASRAGDLHKARSQAQEAGWSGRRLRVRLTGEIAALSPAASRSDRSFPAAGFARVQGRVLHLVTNAMPEITAGYTVRTHAIARTQNQSGLDAQVATRVGFPVSNGFLAARSTADLEGVRYHRALPLRGLPLRADEALALDVAMTARLVRRLKPAVLHAHSKHVNAQVALALRDRFGLPVVYEVRGFLEETWRSRGHSGDTDLYRMVQAVETSCMRAADVVVTLAEVMRRAIVNRGVDPDRVVVVPNAVDDVFLAPPPDAGEVRQRLGIRQDEFVVGLIGTLNAYEGVGTLIEAVARLRRRGVPARLLVVGTGPAAAGLRDQAVAHEVAEVCSFTGSVPFARVRDYHAALDVFCVPRLDLPVCRLVPPLKPLEAMATGRPVVASDLPPLREIVEDGCTGAFVPPGDPEGLADRLEVLAADEDERVRMGERARAWVAEHRTWTSLVASYHSIYAQLGVIRTVGGVADTSTAAGSLHAVGAAYKPSIATKPME
jgi:glycosyltransferase involved in cell wall biosynthesis